MEARMFAVDLGASGGKCFAGFAAANSFSMCEVHRFAHEPVAFFAAGGTRGTQERLYWDDTLLYGNIVQGLHAYRRMVSDTLDSIGIDAWGADGALMSADGEMLGKIYCYRDHRLDGMIEEVKERIGVRRLYEITGVHFQPFNVSNQLCWLANHRRDLLLPGCFYLPVPSLFYYYLGGVRAVDSTWASVTQLMDARSRQWSREIFEKLGIPMGLMPPIVEPGTALGEIFGPLAAVVSVNRARLTAVCSHDTAAAFAAAPIADSSRSLIISSGTWSLVGKLVPAPITTEAAMTANVSNEGGVGNIRLLKNCIGTWLVQELRRVWRMADGRDLTWDEMNRLARGAPEFEAFIDPDYPGFYNPPNMEQAIMDFCRLTGQRSPAGRGAFLRSVYEGLALKYRTVNREICEVSGTESEQVNVVGGGCRNEMLLQFTANALAMPVYAGPEEATAVGNLVMQAVGVGALESVAAAAPLIRESFKVRQYTPEAGKRWDDAYRRFVEVCDTARSQTGSSAQA